MAQTDLEKLVYQMSVDVRTLENGNKRALVNVRDTAREAQREYDKLATEMGETLGRGSNMAGAAFGAVTSYAVKAAMEAAATERAFKAAFGNMTPEAQKFAETYSDQVGRALDETQAQMARAQLTLTSLGINAGQALKATEAIQARAVDMGALWEVEDAEAYQAILSGIAGDAEPLRRFGVALSDAAVNQELLRLGYRGNTDEAAEAARSLARLNIILDSTTVAEGAAIQTKEGLANQVKVARAEFREIAIELGSNFLPLATDMARAANDMLVEFRKLPEGVQLGALALLGLVAAGGPIAKAVEGFTKLIQFAQAARAAMVGIPAVGAAAGGAGGGRAVAGLAAGTLATGGLAAVGVGYTAIGIAGMAKAIEGGNRVTAVKNLLADPSLVREMSDADIVKLQGLLRKDASRKGEHAQTMYGDFGVNTTPAKNALGILAGEANARAEAKAKAAAGKPVGPDGFPLPPGLRKPVGGGGSGVSHSVTGPSEAEKAAELAESQAENFTKDLISAQNAELNARKRLATTAEARAEIELERIAAAEKARNDELDLAVQKGKLTKAQAEEIQKLEAKARKAERELVELERQEAIRADAYRLSSAMAGYEASILASQMEMAHTFGERSALERRALELRQAQETAALEDDIARNPGRSDEENQRRRAGLASTQAAAMTALASKQKDELKASILGAFEAAKGGSGALADYFGERLKAKLLDSLADKLAAWLQKLGAAEGGQGGGGILSSVAKLASSFAGLFDSGGSIAAGEWGIAGERGAEIIKGPATVVSSGATLRALSGTATTPSVGGDRVIHVVTEASDYFTTKVRQEATPIAVSAGVAASQTGADRAIGAVRGQNRYRIAGA